MKINLKIKYLRMNDEKEYEENLTFILKELEVKHEITSSDSSQSNEKAE